MATKNKKKITSFNIDESILDEFDKLCNEEDKNRSKLANRLFSEFIGKNKRRK